MLLGVSLVVGLLIAWGAVVLFLIVIAVWRSVLSMREEDQLFIDPGEEHLAREQRAMMAKVDRLRPYFIAGITGTVLLGVITFAVWVFQSLWSG